MKSAGTRGYSPLARVMTLAVMLLAMAATAWAQEPTKYTVKMAENTVDKDNWTISPTEAAEGKPITATYSGSRHVKSVTAVVKAAAKPAATVTTAPTATTGDIVAGSETALVSGGAATGGTMMYKVTTENTQPTTTEGFSATVPTAKTLAAGTYYVWYYVQADDTHTDSEISATAIAVTIAAAAPATITVTWNNDDITGHGTSFTKDGVTITASMIDLNDKNFMSGGTFTTTLGNFTKIEVTTGNFNASGTGWSGSGKSGTWTGTPASSVSFSGDIMGMSSLPGNTTKFVFTIEPTN